MGGWLLGESLSSIASRDIAVLILKLVGVISTTKGSRRSMSAATASFSTSSTSTCEFEEGACAIYIYPR